MTGCKDIYNSIDALHILFVELSKTRGVYNTKTRKIEDVTFLIKTDPSALIIDNLLNIKIAMINSNYDIGFEIDRDKLFGLVESNKKQHRKTRKNIAKQDKRKSKRQKK